MSKRSQTKGRAAGNQMTGEGGAEALLLFFNDSRQKNPLLDHLNDIPGIDARCVLRFVPLPLRIIRRIQMAVSWRGIGCWLLSWKRNIDQYSLVVCVASRYSPQILRWISAHNPEAKLINYYWDTIAVSNYPVEECYQFENWSFDRDDCDEYGMKHNPQFYAEALLPDNVLIAYDVCYVGADRNGTLSNRRKLLIEYCRLFDESGIKSFIWFVSDSSELPDHLRRKAFLPEQDYYEVVARSKALLDIVDPDHAWMTLRPLLGLSNGKKVITNNRDIMKEPYYSAENVFVLGVDSPSSLKTFLERPFEKIPENVLGYYSAEKWVGRFLELL